MKHDLNQMKLSELGPLCQVTLFEPDGQIIESCDTLITIQKEVSIYEQFNFLMGIQEVIMEIKPDEPLVFELVEWTEQKDALFGMKFHKNAEGLIQWFILDKTAEKDQILAVQQSRNNASISEEVLEMKQQLLETEKRLLGYRNEELLRVQKFKERFFAEVSHEMRTPLNSITGLVKLLEWSEPKAIYDYLHALKATSEHLNHIINDVLDLSKVEEGKLQLEYLGFNLHEITSAILKGFSMAAGEKRIRLRSNIDRDIPHFILTDPIRLSQVLFNIVGNAMKFTHDGSICLNIKLNKVVEEQYFLAFEVTDTGIGMSEESIHKILEPYAQVEGQSYYEYGGTGLGMGIALHLIQALGGQLDIKSTKGKGTSMSFEIPCKAAQKADYTVDDHYDPAANIDTQNYSFLFAEDDAMSALIMKERATKWNLKSTFVSNINELKNELNNTTHDILVTDVHLGDGNAMEVIKSLRTSDSKNKDIPVLFLSGDVQSEHSQLNELTNWGYLVKPVNPKSLSLKIREMLNLNDDNTLEPVDLTHLKAAAQNDTDFVLELIDTILEHLPADMEKLSQALADQDAESARKLLHKMNPSISYLGIDSLIEERKALHDKVAEGQSIVKELSPFKARINMALEDLAAQKEELRAS